MKRAVLLSGFLAGACSSPSVPSSAQAALACPSARKGAPTQFKHTALATIDGPIFCDEGAFIRVHGRAAAGSQGLHGQRKLEMGHPAAETGPRWTRAR
jgi:hypothetical protein